MTKADRVTLITGAASGIGLATATRLAREGTGRLILVDRDAEALARIDLPCTLDLLPGDVASEAFWTSAAPYLGGLNAAVISAGVGGTHSVAGTKLAEWRRIMSVNLDGAFLTLRTAIRTIEGPGAIVAVGSATAATVKPYTGCYAASKAALVQLVRVAALENAQRGLRINVIAPSGVETPLWDQIPVFAERAQQIGRDATFAERGAANIPLGRYATAAEVAEQIAFLLSDAAALMTGSVLLCDGGYAL